jgi:polyisoprenoid-binding protein YceI
MLRSHALLALGLALATSPLAASSWHFDTHHTEVGFEVVHLGVSKVRGHFKDYQGKILLDEKDLTKSKVELTIPVSSVDTGTAKRDSDLQGEPFFGAEKNPNISFKSTSVTKTAEGYDLTGDLTIHGTTKPVTLQATITDAVTTDWGATKRGFSLRATINRFDYNVNWGAKTKLGTLVASEKVALVIDGEIDQDQEGGKPGKK